MKLASFILFLMTALAEAGDGAGAKSKLNTQIYEKSPEEASFQAVVQVVRNVREETEVIFQGQKGFYTVAPGASQELLIQSQKKKIPVTVQVNPESRLILKVESSH